MKPGIVFLATGAVLVFCILVAGCTQNLSGYIPSPGTSGNPVIDANNRFSFDLYSQLAGDAANKDQNLFFSPWSISSAMAVTYEGARNKTAGKIRNVFHFPENRIVLRDGYASLNSGLNPNNPAYTLRTANALWAEKSWPFLPEYSRIALKSYGAHAENLDFVHDAEGSRNAINSWVGEKTDEKISHLVSPGEITPVTRLIITNGIFFRGTWAKQFDQNKTADQAFSLPSGGTIPVRMMARNDRNAFFRYGETDRVQVLEMPYVNGTGTPLSMFILLPREKNLDRLERSLDARKFYELKRSLSKQLVMVYIPKFRLETRYDLSQNLAEMGIPAAFSPSADLSGMDGTQDLMIDKIIHNAYIDINEEGTEAAGATYVKIVLKGDSQPPHPRNSVRIIPLFLLSRIRKAEISFSRDALRIRMDKKWGGPGAG